MNIFLRGVRGSIANPVPETAFYGGNTTCIEMHGDDGALLFFDAGTGLREAGNLLPESGECHIFISHGHIDHIVGLWFFKPLHSPEWTTHLYLPDWLMRLPDQFFTSGMFPVPFSHLNGRVIQHQISAGDHVAITPQTTVTALSANHPGNGLAYRARTEAATFFYSGDHEITPETKAATLAMLDKADIAVVDAMFSRKDYIAGWGHSTWEDWLEVAGQAGVKHLVLSHHAPERSDLELDGLDQQLVKRLESAALSVYIGREGLHFGPDGAIPPIRQESDWLLRFLNELGSYREEGAILDITLAKAREISHADAGTIYLVENGDLIFAYTHNDSLFSVNSAYKHAYSRIRLPMDETSVVGYVAATGNPVLLDDARVLPEDAPYRFNSEFDEHTGYQSVSMLTVPFSNSRGKVLGVMQLINSLDTRTGKPCPFTPDMLYTVRLLAREVGSVIQYRALQRRNVHNILRMATMHDPSETGMHAERVGSIAAELFQRWAIRQKLEPQVIRFEKSNLRLAAMLHDVGKVGISDLILKKPGKLTEKEFLVMRDHTRYGATILETDNDDLSDLARDIALHHHQKWNGQGYADSTDEGRLAGEEIPLAARITAVADVFDALVSPRCYKNGWTFEAAFAHLCKESGKHFDPLLVTCMEEIRGMLKLIYLRYPDQTAG